jgi:thiol:disulfide interchange protein DsbC
MQRSEIMSRCAGLVLSLTALAGFAHAAQPVGSQPANAPTAPAANAPTVAAGAQAAATAGATGPGTGAANATAAEAAAGADPRSALLKLLPPGSKLEDLKPAPIAGLYQFTQGAEVSYLTADGRYFIDGNVYDMRTRENLTEQLKTQLRAQLLASIPESQMVIFSPKNPRYTITVFTDIDCPYCRKLHGDMAELNRLGIRVRYLFYPRTGPNTESWRKAEVVWCSADRNEALTRAKAGAALDMNKTCGQTPVGREYALGQQIGVRGTPAILTESGAFIDGYMPPRDLLRTIQQLQVAQR